MAILHMRSQKCSKSAVIVLFPDRKLGLSNSLMISDFSPGARAMKTTQIENNTRHCAVFLRQHGFLVVVVLVDQLELFTQGKEKAILEEIENAGKTTMLKIITIRMWTAIIVF